MANPSSERQREDAQFRVLNLLKKHPDFSQRQIASELGISLGRVNYCLRALVGKGYIKIENFRAADNKLRYLHVLTPTGISQRTILATEFIKRKLREYELLKQEIEALQNDETRANTRRFD